MQELENYLNENESILKDIKYQRKTWQLFEDNLQKKSFQKISNFQIERKQINDSLTEADSFLQINLENWRKKRKLQLK